MPDKELLEEELLREAADFFKALGNDTPQLFLTN